MPLRLQAWASGGSKADRHLVSCTSQVPEDRVCSQLLRLPPSGPPPPI